MEFYRGPVISFMMRSTSLKTSTSTAAAPSASTNVKDWLDQFVAQNGIPVPQSSSNYSTSTTSIWVEDPETYQEQAILGGQKGYVSYRIMFKQAGRDLVTVRHRYSEFETLRKNLKEVYVPLGIYIPAIPPKYLNPGSKNSANEEFIKERTLGLSLFCEAIVSSPWLRNDRLWKDFMKPNATSSLGATVGVASGMDDGSGNIGEVMLRETLQQLEIPYKSSMPQRIEEVREEATIVEKHARGLMEKARHLQHCERALQAAQDAIGAQLGLWSDAERIHVKSLSGKAFGERECNIICPHEAAHATVEAAAELFKTKTGIEEQRWECTGITLVVALEQELTNLEALKELLRTHDEMLASIESLRSRLFKAEKLAQAQTVSEMKRALEEKRSNLHTFYKGFVLFSLPVFSRQRAASLRRLLGGLIAANCYAPTYPLLRNCVQFFQRLEMSPSLATADTSRLLEQLYLRSLPLGDLPPDAGLGPGADTAAQATSVFTSQPPLAQLYERALIISRGGTLPVAAFNLSKQAAAAVPNGGSLPSSPSSAQESFGTPTGESAGGAVAKANPLQNRRGSAVLQSRGSTAGRGLVSNPSWTAGSSGQLPSDGSEESTSQDFEIASSDAAVGLQPAARPNHPRRSTVSSSLTPSTSNENIGGSSMPIVNDRVMSLIDELTAASLPSDFTASTTASISLTPKKDIWGD